MKELTEKLAQLSRIDISQEETQYLAEELEKQIEYLSILDDLEPELALPGIKPAVLREDRVRPSLDRKVLFMNTPNHNEDYFVLPGCSRE